MSCFLCGHEEGHHLGCMAHAIPGLTEEQAIEKGFLATPPVETEPPEIVVEVLVPGSMATVPEESPENNEHTAHAQALAGETVGQCEHGECHNPRYSSHPRAKFCEDHRDPKNRKE